MVSLLTCKPFWRPSLTKFTLAVVVEKPFTQTSEEADNLLALAKEKGVILTVYQSTFTICHLRPRY